MKSIGMLKVPFWIIVCILVPLIYLFAINPLFFGFLFSPGMLTEKSEAKREVRSFLKDKYKQSFEIISFQETNLYGGFEGRVLSKKDDIVFNVYKRLSGFPQNDYLLKAWAKPFIDPLINDGEVLYEVEFRDPPLSWNGINPDERDKIIIDKPQDLAIYIYFVYTEKMSRSQLYSIVQNFKNQKIKDVSIILFQALKSPDLNEINKQDFRDYIESNEGLFSDTCIIDNYTMIQTEEDILASSECINVN